MGQCQRKVVGHESIIHRRIPDRDVAPPPECAPLFSGLLPGSYRGILALARVKEFERKEMLYIEGDSVGQALLLTSGLVKITKIAPSGTEIILRLCGAGDVLGAEGQFGISTHSTTAHAFRLCRALVWEASVFKALVEPFPLLHQNMARILGAYMLELEERFREVATVSVGPRVARQVIRLLKQIGHPVDGAVEISLSREDLAQMTGTTLFTVSRLFSAWEALGIVRPRREAVEICDIPSLRAISQEC